MPPDQPGAPPWTEDDASLDRRYDRVPSRRPGVGLHLGLAVVVALVIWITGPADVDDAAWAALLTAAPTTLGRLWRDHQRIATALPAAPDEVLSAEDSGSGDLGADLLLGVLIVGCLAAVGALFDEGIWWGIGAALGIVIGSDLRALALRAIVPRLHPTATLGHRLDGNGDDVYRLFADSQSP